MNADFGKVAFKLIDINGRIVFSQTSNLSGLTRLNFENIQSGMYILNISGRHININEKVIIN